MTMILEPGKFGKAKKNSNRFAAFQCPSCDCQFTATFREYHVLIKPSIFVCECPMCGCSAITYCNREQKRRRKTK